jgi:hypothetical protein
MSLKLPMAMNGNEWQLTAARDGPWPENCCGCPARLSVSGMPEQRFDGAKVSHEYFLELAEAGDLKVSGKAGPVEYERVKRITWRWKSIDGNIFDAREASNPNPVDPRNQGSRCYLPMNGAAFRCRSATS